MAGKGPGLFSNIGKEARDLLTNDYSSDQKFTITSFSDAGVALNSTVVKRGGLYSGDVAARYRYKHATVGVNIDTECNVLSILTVANILHSTNAIASLKLPDYDSGKLEVQYSHEHAAFTTAIALNKSPTFDISATVGTPSIAFGAEANYSIVSGITKYNAGVSLTKPYSNASIILGDKGDSLRASYLHHLKQLNGGAVVGEVSRTFSTNKNTLTVGCSYVVDPLTIVKAKLNNHGDLGAVLRHEIKPKKSFLTVSCAFDTKALMKNPKFGLALALHP